MKTKLIVLNYAVHALCAVFALLQFSVAADIGDFDFYNTHESSFGIRLDMV